MEYTIKELSKLANISRRTLRFYDEIGLLKPHKINSSGYRIYGSDEVDRLQIILFYRELGFELKNIKKIIDNTEFDPLKALKDQLQKLEMSKHKLEILIDNVKNTILNKEGMINMSDEQKFIGFKEKMIEENENKYGDEIRKKYGDEEINYSNQKLKNMTKEEYDKIQKLSLMINEKLKIAFKNGDPQCDIAQEVCRLHKEWLTFYWKSYSKEAHKELAQMYVNDERFKKYYDSIEVGCAEFLRDSINYYVENN